MLITTPATPNSEVNIPVGSGLQTIYRQTLQLSLATGGEADGVIIDPEQTRFAAQFREEQYDLLDANNPFAERFSTQTLDDALVVKLDRPLRIQRIQLPSQQLSRLTEVLNAIEYGFFDSQLQQIQHNSLSAVATNATTTLYKNRENLIDAAKQAYKQGKVWQTDTQTITLHRMDGTTIVDAPTLQINNNQPLTETFISNHFAIRCYSSSGTEQPLSRAMLTSLWVKSVPTNPRIGVAKSDPERDETVPGSYFWRLGGEQLDTIATEAINLQADNLLAEALQAHLDGYFQNLLTPYPPASIVLTLVLESDTPCTFSLPRLQIPYQLIRQASSLMDTEGAPLDKTVLRFQGEHLQTEQIQLHLPHNAQINSAKLKTAPSFTGDNARPLMPLPPQLKESSSHGIQIAANSWAAQGVRPEKAVTLTGLLLGLLTLQEKTQLHIEVREGWNDGPNGALLAKTEITATSAGVRKWFRADFDDSIVLDSILYWIVIKAAKGSAVWLAGETRGEPFRGYRDRTPNEAPRIQTALNDKAGLYCYLSGYRKADQLPFKVEIEGVEATVSALNEKDAVLDITRGLAARQTDVVDIKFITPIKGMLTAYSAQIAYELT